MRVLRVIHAAGQVECEVYYNSHYVSSGGAEAAIHLSIESPGARHVTIEPRTVAVPYSNVTTLRCAYHDADSLDIAKGLSWSWLVNGNALTNTGQSSATEHYRYNVGPHRIYEMRIIAIDDPCVYQSVCHATSRGFAVQNG